MDVVYARAPRRALDNDLSVEAPLQGVPGGLGGDFNATLFAATTVLAGDATTLMSPGSSGSSSGVETAPEAPQQPQQQQQVGHVVTAKFDVYSGRRRKLESSQLDEFLAGLSEAYSATPAAAAAATLPAAAANTAMASGTAATAAAAAASGPSAAEGAAVITTTTKGSSSSSGRSTGPVQSSASKGQSAMEKALAYKQQQQLGVKHASAKGTGGDSSNSSGMLPPDIIPMAT
jgi:hypothetical protein